MRNTRYKLVALSDLRPAFRLRLEEEMRERFDSLVNRGKDYETAQDLAIKLAGCEVIFVNDVPVIHKRINAH
jgi:hypothetical protein